ncbi:electron transport complex subunit RsxG [Arsukibacterium sp.]|uniref:electron transport complex subunit RsxG n=1 Tax=Arsukibacterium sp. TaxID=1977258 RepID=UPI002FDB4F7F
MLVKLVSKNAVILSAVALLCVAILGTVQQLTQPRIAEQILANKLAILHEVLPDASAERELLQDCILITAPEFLGRNSPQAIYRWRQQGVIGAYIIETTAPDGYSGNIDLIVAVSPDGTVLGSRVLNHQETPGLGDKIDSRRDNWIFGFSGKAVAETNKAAWAVKKEGGQFDQFTGATITPRAVINAIYRAARLVQLQPELADAKANCGDIL